MTRADADLMKAQLLTPGDTSDDLAVLTRQRGDAKARFDQAVAEGDDSAILKWGAQLQSTDSAIAELRGAVEALTSQLADMEKARAEGMARLYNTSQAQYGALSGAFAEWLSTSLGGRVGSGLRTPSAAGTVARL